MRYLHNPLEIYGFICPIHVCVLREGLSSLVLFALLEGILTAVRIVW